MAKASSIILGGPGDCKTIKGKDLDLYKCVVKCLEERSGQHVMQGRVILVFEPKPKRAKKKKTAVRRLR